VRFFSLEAIEPDVMTARSSGSPRNSADCMNPNHRLPMRCGIEPPWGSPSLRRRHSRFHVLLVHSLPEPLRIAWFANFNTPNGDNEETAFIWPLWKNPQFLSLARSGTSTIRGLTGRGAPDAPSGRGASIESRIVMEREPDFIVFFEKSWVRKPSCSICIHWNVDLAVYIDVAARFGLQGSLPDDIEQSLEFQFR